MKIEGFKMKCAENKYYDTNDVRGIWMRYDEMCTPSNTRCG